MHIPNEMIEGAICPVTAVVSAVGVTAAAYFAFKSKEKPTASRFGAVAAVIFAAQMMNFPVQSGTSGHLIGATLAAALLGTPFGVLAMSIVLAIQCLVFSDGGLTVLGANIFNMAIIGSISGGIIHELFLKKKTTKIVTNSLLIGVSAWISVMLAAFACSIELGISGTIKFSKVLPSMISVHALIGIGEAVITVAAYLLFSSKQVTKSTRISFGVPLLTAGILGLVLSPFASGFPDGLEWVAEKFHFLHDSSISFVRPFPDYTFPLINNEILSTGLAGIIGVIITFLFVFGLGKLVNISSGVLTTQKN